MSSNYLWQYLHKYLHEMILVVPTQNLGFQWHLRLRKHIPNANVKNIQRSRIPWAKGCSSGRPAIPAPQRLVREWCYCQSDLCWYYIDRRLLTPGLCGSDLHGMWGVCFSPFPASLFHNCLTLAIVYRGYEKGTRTGYIIGHEFTGTVISVGCGVKTFKSGDLVISPFTRYRRLGMWGK